MHITPNDKKGLHILYGPLFSEKESNIYFKKLENEILYLKNIHLNIYGKKYPIARKIAAYGDEGTYYTFSGLTLRAIPWTDTLMEIKNTIEKHTGEVFNFVLVTRYSNGQDTIGPHQDNEKDLKKESSIATVSFGQNRKFKFSKRYTPSVTINVQNGSLLLMKYPTNCHWYHSVPKCKNAKNVRISLTFRLIK